MEFTKKVSSTVTVSVVKRPACKLIFLPTSTAAYPYERFDWKPSENGPTLCMGAESATGARTAVPVEKA